MKYLGRDIPEHVWWSLCVELPPALVPVLMHLGVDARLALVEDETATRASFGAISGDDDHDQRIIWPLLGAAWQVEKFVVDNVQTTEQEREDCLSTVMGVFAMLKKMGLLPQLRLRSPAIPPARILH